MFRLPSPEVLPVWEVAGCFRQAHASGKFERGSPLMSPDSPSENGGGGGATERGEVGGDGTTGWWVALEQSGQPSGPRTSLKAAASCGME